MTYFWLGLGFLGQALFSGRFIIQWLTSERARRSIVPITFWWLSLCGGTALFVYALHNHDPVISVGQGFGLLVYVRNLWIIRKETHGSKPAASEDLVPSQ